MDLQVTYGWSLVDLPHHTMEGEYQTMIYRASRDLTLGKPLEASLTMFRS